MERNDLIYQGCFELIRRIDLLTIWHFESPCWRTPPGEKLFFYIFSKLFAAWNMKYNDFYGEIFMLSVRKIKDVAKS